MASVSIVSFFGGYPIKPLIYSSLGRNRHETHFSTVCTERNRSHGFRARMATKNGRQVWHVVVLKAALV